RHTRWPRDWSSDVCSSDLTTRQRSSAEGRAMLSRLDCGCDLFAEDHCAERDPKAERFSESDHVRQHLLIGYRRKAVQCEPLSGRSEERRVGKECRARWTT